MPTVKQQKRSPPLLSEDPDLPRARFWRNPGLICLLVLAALGLGSHLSRLVLITDFHSLIPGLLEKLKFHPEVCPQVDVLVPEKNGAVWGALSRDYGSEVFQARAVDWLGGAVKVPTESFDDLGPIGEDARWEAFGPFHSYLLKAFPKIHSILQLTKVNTYGLLYTWAGSDKSLKPLVLMAHQDVVPVDPSTLEQWSYPPYSGYFDGQSIWGRGSSDDKSGLIGIMSSVETLLEKGFQPVRTVVLSFGFDEEIIGPQGAKQLAKALLDLYGEGGVAMVVDEGGGFAEQYGSAIATPGIAEKGYFDLTVEVTTAGGHSSIPPKHTSIGILSALLLKYESHRPEARLTRKDPLYAVHQCIAEHAPDVPPRYRKVIKHAAHSDVALRALEKILFKKLPYKSLVETTQAIDMIQGGVKANALPERAAALINHRISIDSSVSETQVRSIKLLKPLARKFNLTMHAFGKNITGEMDGTTASGTLTLSDAFGTAVDPAPVTPTGPDSAPYRLLSGTIKATYNSHRQLEDKDNIIITPSMPAGNTDTRCYWNLTKHIFRYDHYNSGTSENELSGGVHTVNEHIGIGTFLEQIRFFTTLILNVDEASDL